MGPTFANYVIQWDVCLWLGFNRDYGDLIVVYWYNPNIHNSPSTNKLHQDVPVWLGQKKLKY